jgi:ATP-dependent helicase Lhr and Lhr-like helicase
MGVQSPDSKTSFVVKPAIRSFYEMKGFGMNQMQIRACEDVEKGRNGLLVSPTGSGKTFALSVPFMSLISDSLPLEQGIGLIWITPLKALSTDIFNALTEVGSHFSAPLRVALRHGDLSAAKKQQMTAKPPHVLVITPESLHIMLSTRKGEQLFRHVKGVIVDEWHELMGSKRGVQTTLALSYLKSICGKIQVWGVSASIGNTNHAMEVLLYGFKKGVLRTYTGNKKIAIQVVYPEEMQLYPAAGHHGLRMSKGLKQVLDASGTCLVFTNTRSQSELWYGKLLEDFPALAGQMAIHHGSLGKDIRSWVEWALHQRWLKVVVCTSSLDLGVDFRPVDTVVQVGSPKGVARFVQRAGRSGHAPGEVSTIWFLPTHSLEVIELVAIKEAVKHGQMEHRIAPVLCYDVLSQWMVTLACGPGFLPTELFQMVKNTHAFHLMDEEAFYEVLRFVVHGGNSFKEYKDYRKVSKDADGVYRVCDRRVSFRHRMQIGTIYSISGYQVVHMKGKNIGTVEDYFIQKLHIGDCFNLSGKTWQIKKIDDNRVQVAEAPAGFKSITPAWQGGRLSFSSEITRQLQEVLRNIDTLRQRYPELKLLDPIIALQKTTSALPGGRSLLAEVVHISSGTHLFMYPFEGRRVNEALAMLVAYRLGKRTPSTFSVSVNDYGFELYTDQHLMVDRNALMDAFSLQDVQHDLLATTNFHELLRKKFEEISTISGMMPKGGADSRVQNKHLRNTSSLIFKVLREFEPDHIFLRQAADEVRLHYMEESRMYACMQEVAQNGIDFHLPGRFSPFSIPLMAERLRERMSTEQLEDRLNAFLKEMQDYTS